MTPRWLKLYVLFCTVVMLAAWQITQPGNTVVPASNLTGGLSYVAPELDISSASNGNGVLGLSGNTSGKCTQTTDATGTTITFNCFLSLPAGALSTPAIQNGTAGFYFGTVDAAANGIIIKANGNNTVGEMNAGIEIGAGSGIGWSSTTNVGLVFDTAISRGAAGVISVDTTAMGNGLGTIQPGLYASKTNCSAVGTAANPSVVSCSAAPAGSFSCATNASTGTCVVNTTAVTANSEILITGRNDTTTGTRLGVTCNTGITTAIPEIAAVTAATSFTINLGTFTTNPECFSYFIVN